MRRAREPITGGTAPEAPERVPRHGADGGAAMAGWQRGGVRCDGTQKGTRCHGGGGRGPARRRSGQSETAACGEAQNGPEVRGRGGSARHGRSRRG